MVRSLAVTTLYVTHDPTEALAVADRVALLHEGRVRQLDPPGTLYDRPVDLVARPRSRRSAWCRRGWCTPASWPATRSAR